MIKSFLLFLFLCLALSPSFGQCSGALACDASIFLCRYGDNIIGDYYEDGYYQVAFYGDDSAPIIYTSVSSASGGSIIINLNWVSDFFPTSGIYEVTCPETGNTCWGTFIAEPCIDFIDFDGCKELANHKCDPDYVSAPYSFTWVRHVCLGDTTLATFGEFVENPGYVAQPFHPSRIECSVGKVIDYTEDEFTMLWTEVGRSCVSLKTTTAHGTELLTGVNVVVNPTEPFKISSDKGDSLQAEICIGESINLTIDASHEINPQWQVDGEVYYGLENTLSFDQAGEYTLQIGNQDPFGCNCIPDIQYTIVVKEGDSPSIECKRTVCLGESTTYYSVSECDSYIWDVGLGGIITAGGGLEDSYVTVEWNTGPTNEISLSTPSCFEVACNESITETISIIDPSVSIDGLDLVCPDDLVTYAAPDFTGTNFEWDVGVHGDIINGQGTNKIQVRWDSDAGNSIGMVSVYYNNCNLGCDGYAEIPVKIFNRLEIGYTSLDLCRNSNYTFETNLGINVDWILDDFDGNTTMYPFGNSLELNLSAAGDYRLEIINPALTSCNSSAVVHFEVLKDIPPIIQIEGPHVICLGTLSKYSIPNLSSVETVQWEVKDGGFTTNFGSSKSLFYTWQSAGPYEISIVVQNTITGCESAQTVFVFDNDISLIGLSDLCIGGQAEYTLPEYNNFEATWSIDPPSAGTIITSKEDWASVIWSEEGTHRIIANYCERELEVEVTIHPFPSASYIYDDIVCKNELSSLNVATDASNSIEVFNGSNTSVSTSINSNLPAGEYTVEVNSPFGCSIFENISIQESDDFEIEINILSSQHVCPPFNPFEVFIEKVSSNYSYQWYHNNIPVGGNSPSYMITELGSYHLVVTDKNGCQAKSNNEVVSLCCSGGGGDPVNIPGVTMDITEISCNVRDFEILEPHQSTDFDWTFFDPYSGTSTANGNPVNHTFVRAGTYLVKAVGNALCDQYEVDVCGALQTLTLCEGTQRYIEIPLVADFSIEAKCIDEPTDFIDETTMLPSIGNVTYNWDFGDVASANNTSTSQAPSHIFSSPGNYTITLEVTAPGNCVSTISKSVEIKAPPTIDILGQADYCIGLLSTFESITSESGLKHEWDFGDPGSGNNNYASSASAEHLFSAFGTFLVSLNVTDDRGCITSTTLEIEVVDNVLEGNISNDIEMPKCPEDFVTLTAPAGGISFLWSTGDTTSSIQVSHETSYNVTIYDDAGCEYTPPDFNVFNYEISDSRIYSFKNSVIVYDSIDICQGDHFDLHTSEIGNAKYVWTTVTDDDWLLEYDEHFEFLEPGQYSYSVSITDTVAGCTVLAGPFIVNVHEELKQPLVTSDDGSYCENDMITLRVDPFEPGHSYEWSNGQSGEFINVYSSGSYEVTVTNVLGCRSVSDKFRVRPVPGNNEWMTGCMEVCFPREFCLNLNTDNNYNLILNGTDIGPINNSLSVIDLELPGDYELLVTNEYGCQSKSDILSLSAIPVDQTLEGIVFLDENENSVYDGNDVLQEGVTVFLMIGNTVIRDTVTDINGYYNFDPVFQSNLRVVLDLTSIDFTFEGVSDSTLVYDHCVEDKEVHFPLVSICTSPIQIDTFYTCPDMPVLIHGNYYNANDIDTTVVNLDALCDSTYILRVYSFEDPTIELDVLPSCVSNSNGELTVTTLNGDDLDYSLTPDFAIVDSIYSGLEAGTFTLYVRSTHGCLYAYPFTIEEIEEPDFELIATGTCANQNAGELEINVFAGDNLLFSLEENSDFTDQLTYTDLEEGEVQVYVLDSLGCIYNDIITIESYDSPQIEIIQETFCEGDDFGSLSISILEGNPTFSIDNSGIYSSDTLWNELSAGPHVLYMESQFGCLDSFSFILEPVIAPILDIATSGECENINLGSAEISSNIEDLEYSIDGINFSMDLTYEDLTGGSYTLYTRTPEGCLFEQAFYVDQFIEPQLTLLTQQSCINELNGALDIISTDTSAMQYSINGLDYYANSNFENLEKGEYTLSVQIMGSSCEYYFPFIIEEVSAPDIDIVETSTCEGTSNGIIDVLIISGAELTFNIDGNGVYNSVTHFDNLDEGEYILAAKDTLGCTYEYPVSITSLPEPDFTLEGVNSCDNIDNGSITILSEAVNALTSLNGGPFSNNLLYEDLAEGIYEVELVNDNQCSKMQIVEILSNPPLEVALEDYPLDCYSEELEIKPVISSHHGELQYLWNTDETSQVILATASGAYDVTISDFCDEVYLSTNIEISHFDNDNPFYFANIFSPNDDNINDCFQAVVDPTYNIISYNISVFDRWGNLLYSSEDVDGCWDGKFNNSDVVPGVYMYIINMKIDHCEGIKDVKKIGDVTVVR